GFRHSLPLPKAAHRSDRANQRPENNPRSRSLPRPACTRASATALDARPADATPPAVGRKTVAASHRPVRLGRGRDAEICAFFALRIVPGERTAAPATET